MIKLFLKEMILNINDLYLMLKYDEFTRIFDYLPLLIGEDNINIYIFIL